MSRSLNKVMLIGNLGNDPEIRTTPSGTRVAKLSLATNETYQDRSGQQQQRTEWHRLTVFGRLVDVVEQWVKKGDRLYVEGRIEYSQNEDDQGNVRYFTDIVIREMIMLGSGTGGHGAAGGAGMGGEAQGGQGDAPPNLDEPDDDLPF